MADSTREPWPAPPASRPLHALAPVPGSKSETNRALVLAALSTGPSHLRGALFARDTELMMAALRRLGVGIDDSDRDDVLVTPPPEFTPCPDGIDCGLAGNVMRFVPAVAALAPGTTAFYGDPAASARPIAPLLEALRQLGVQIDSQATRLPFELTAPTTLPGRQVSIDASASSQFVSALLLSGARYPQGLDLRHHGQDVVPSLPHINMTIQMLRERGVRVDDAEPNRWLVAPGMIEARDVQAEPDLTNAAAFLAAGLLSRGQVSVPGWPKTTTQPGAQFLEVAARFGAAVGTTPGQATVAWQGPLHGVDVDLHEASELTPVVAALALFASGQTMISGVAHIRGHETDRLAAIASEFGALGAQVTERADGLLIHGVGESTNELAPTRVFACHDDHRLAHLGALVGLRVPGIWLDDIGCTAKTMPDFPQRWSRLFEQEVGS